MNRSAEFSYRALLLASVASTALGGIAQAQTITNTVTVASPNASFILSGGTQLINSATGGILLQAGGAVPSAAILAGSGVVAAITNNGLIQAGAASGIGIHVTSGGSVALITNSGTAVAMAAGGSVITVDTLSSIGTLSNTGLLQASGGGATAVNLLAGGSISALNNGVTGTIAATGTSGVAISIGGTINGLANNGLITATGSNGVAVTIGVGGTLTSLTNTGVISATGTSGIAIGVAGSVGVITNSGLVQSSGLFGTAVDQTAGGSLGSLTNSGTVSATGEGVRVAGALGTLTNSGQITSSGTGGLAVDVASTGSLGVLSNSGTINAPNLAGTAVAVGGILSAVTNNGLIQSGTAAGAPGPYSAIGVDSGGTLGVIDNTGGRIIALGTGAIGINVAGFINGINNSNGTIIATGSNAVAVDVGGLVNTIAIGGSVGASGDGAAAVLIANGGSIGNVSNSGTITTSGSGAAGFNVGGALGSLTNSGQIVSSGLDDAAVNVAVSGTIGTIANNTTGTITATGASGMALNLRGTVGAVTNGGTILAPLGTAIGTGSGGKIGGGITNALSGLIQGGPSNGSGVAIDNASNANALTINNAGSIIGAIRFGTGADALNVTGTGTIVGAITGQGGGGSTIDFAPSGTYALTNPIASVDTINVVSGGFLIQPLGITTMPIAAAKAFNIGSAATVAWNGGTVQSAQFTNSGLLNIGTSNPTISGAYIQTSAGHLGLTFGGTANGLLSVTGSATVSGTAGGIIVNVPTNLATSLIGRTFTILSSSTLSVSSPASLTVSFVSPFVALDVSETGSSILLTGSQPSIGQTLATVDDQLNGILGTVATPGDSGATDGLVSTGLTNAVNVRIALMGLLEHLASVGDWTDYYHIINALSALTPAQQAQVLRQLEPGIIMTAQALIGSVISINDGATRAIEARQTAARNTTGLSAGDDVGRGFQVWAQPFGSYLTQSAKEGIDGFTANTYGAALGADTLVLPELRLGVALGVGSSDIMFNGNLSGNKSTVVNSQLALYGTWFRNNFFLDGLVGVGMNWNSTKENIPALGVTPHRFVQWQAARGEAGHRI